MEEESKYRFLLLPITVFCGTGKVEEFHLICLVTQLVSAVLQREPRGSPGKAANRCAGHGGQGCPAACILSRARDGFALPCPCLLPHSSKFLLHQCNLAQQPTLTDAVSGIILYKSEKIAFIYFHKQYFKSKYTFSMNSKCLTCA